MTHLEERDMTGGVHGFNFLSNIYGYFVSMCSEQTIPNMQGELCGHYPMKLLLLEYEREAPSDDEE